MNSPRNDLISEFASTAGGVMTEEAGAITGKLELRTTFSQGRLQALVRYAGAEEWYRITGGTSDTPGASHKEVHERIVEHLTTPGRVVDGNEQAVSLHGFFAP